VAVVLRHRASRWSALTLLALLALAGAEHATAQLAIIWRAVVVSWDNPLTQLHDEAASQGTLSAGPPRQAGVGVVLVPSGRLPFPAWGDDVDQTPVTSQLTRSPPAR
jgi:hypothetical protein